MSRAHPFGTARVLGWLLIAAGVAVLMLGGTHSAAMAADPTPTAPPVLIDPLDPRTGEEASGVGAPLLALLVVVGSGAVVALVTLGYVRLTRRHGQAR